MFYIRNITERKLHYVEHRLLKDNFAYLYDNYVNNYGKDSVDNFFNPKEYVEMYKQGFKFNKKEIL